MFRRNFGPLFLQSCFCGQPTTSLWYEGPEVIYLRVIVLSFSRPTGPCKIQRSFFPSMMSSCPNYEAAKPRNHDGPSTLLHLGDDVFMVVCRAPFYTELHILPKQSAHKTFSQRCCGVSNCSLANCRSWSDGLMNRDVTQLQWFFQAFSCDSEVVYCLTNHSVPLDAHVLGK